MLAGSIRIVGQVSRLHCAVTLVNQTVPDGFQRLPDRFDVEVWPRRGSSPSFLRRWNIARRPAAFAPSRGVEG
jgi:hypothetical protein